VRPGVALAFTLALAASLVAPSPAAADGDGDVDRELSAVVLPGERSPSPKLPEWTGAVRVRPTRASPRAICRAEVVREWLRVRCSVETFAISLLGGDFEGIAFWIDPATHDGEVLMPLRRGGRHVFQLWKAGKDKAGAFTPEPTLVIQEHWLEGAPAPTLTIL
jgi:hypothetical protein